MEQCMYRHVVCFTVFTNVGDGFLVSLESREILNLFICIINPTLSL